MKFKRQLADLEIAKKYPRLKAMQAEIEAAGGRCLIAVWEDIEIPRGNIKPSREGMCSNCKRQVVEISWSGQPANDMEFAGIACRHCHEIIEYVGAGSLDWDSLFGGGS